MDFLISMSALVVAIFPVWISVLAAPPDPKARRVIRILAGVCCVLCLVNGLATYLVTKRSEREQTAAKEEARRARQEQQESNQRNAGLIAEIRRQLQQVVEMNRQLQQLLKQPPSEERTRTARSLIARLPDAGAASAAREIKIQFKDSPLLTHAIKNRITKDLTSFQRYFAGLDIPTPAETPPLGVITGGSGVRVTTNGSLSYQDEIMVGDRSLSDPTVATDGYSWYAIKQFVYQAPSKEAIVSQHTNRAGRALATYYNWSFWNKAPEKQNDQWAATLWKIREKFGQHFTDGMLAVTLRSIHDAPKEDGDPNFNIYFFRKLRVGEAAVDNEHSKLPEFNDIVKRSGLIDDPNVP